MSEDYKSFNDEQLVQLVKDNKPDAFAALSERYLWLMRAKAADFEGPAAPEREDLIQEGFMGLYAAAVSYDKSGGASFKNYAGVCIHNRMADAARRHSSAKNRPLNESLSLDSEDTACMTSGDSLEEHLEIRERFKELLRRANVELTPLERRALSLYLGGCKRAEIPARSGMTLKAFDNAIYRVRDKLKKL